MLSVEFAELSDTGPQRERNEDFCGYCPPATPEEERSRGWFFALADGVGGQARGDLASRTAVESLLRGFRSVPASDSLTAAFPRLIQAANQQVYEAPGSGAAFGSIATTIVICALRHDRAVVAHLGDSRCYLIRRGQATALTRDHTVANEQARMRLLAGRYAAKSETGNLLSRCLGSGLFVNPEISDHLVLPEDILVLCTDGLHRSVQGPEMTEVIAKSTDLRSAAERLIEFASRRDGTDNATVQIIRVKSVERVGMYRGRPYRIG